MDILAFLLGISYCYTSSVYTIWGLGVLCFVSRQYWYILYFVLGFGYSLWHESHYHIPLPPHSKPSHISAVGTITSTPKSTHGATHFEYTTDAIGQKYMHTRIWLTCYQHCPPFRLGGKWSLDISIKPFTPLQPGGFNRYMETRHIQWIGYVRHATYISTPYGWDRLRLYVSAELEKYIPNTDGIALIQGLIIGLSAHISPALWDLFRRTGTTHLVVISGEHIAMFAGQAYLILRFLWSRSYRLCLWCPAPKFASIISILLACVYGFFSGFGVPIQRAVITFTLCTLPYLGIYPFHIWQIWKMALCIVLLLDPHVILMPGFYLSFVAVALLISLSQKIHTGWLRELALIQCVCTIGLMPCTLYFFGYGAWSGIIANLIAVPLVGMVILPLSMIGMLSTLCLHNGYILSLAAYAIHILLYYLEWVDRYSWLNIQGYFPAITTTIGACIGIGLCMTISDKRYYMIAFTMCFIAYISQRMV